MGPPFVEGWTATADVGALAMLDNNGWGQWRDLIEARPVPELVAHEAAAGGVPCRASPRRSQLNVRGAAPI
jgi:hypothetical protein